MKFELRREWPAFAALALMVIVTLIVYSRLPEPMPTHWNAAGEVDGYSSRLVGAWLIPLTSAALYLLLLVIPRIDPRRKNVERFSDVYALMRVGFVLFMAFVQGAIFYAVLTQNDAAVGWLMPVGVGMLFILIGNYMPRVRSNWFMGIRTPWTLSSDRVWRNTHRLGGRLFIVVGLLLMLTALMPAEWIVWVLMGSVLLLSAGMFAYSWWDYQRVEGAQPPDSDL
ncbi:MAG: SdpI family protein [Anaerolineales bacterium]|nr:SdpI family protein [Anaerolineales bacterium]MCB9127725.1 SdpI family protein [Ardenticatenales bacterium]